MRKPVFGVADLVRHKTDCTTIEDGYIEVQPSKMVIWRLEILDLESRGIYMYLCSESKGANQLRGYTAADLYLCFSHIFKKQVFS